MGGRGSLAATLLITFFSKLIKFECRVKIMYFMYFMFLLGVILGCIFSNKALVVGKTKNRIHTDQFPPNSENVILPDIIHFSIFMAGNTGGHKYTHLPLLVESMRLNQKVDFYVISLEDITEKGFGHDMSNLVEKLDAKNVHIVSESLQAFSDRVYDRLNIRVPFTDAWYYKLCDYKPTLAHLFPEFMSKKDYKYWGYGDIDIIWGNVSRFAYLFESGHQFIVSGTYYCIIQP